MSEKVMIDGCDVSGCEHFNKDFSCPNNLEGGYYNEHNVCECAAQGVITLNLFCKDNPDCYYKQLQRAKEENEILKKNRLCDANLVYAYEDLKEDNELMERLLNDILRIFNLGQYDFLKDQNEIIMALEKAVQKDKDFYEFTELNAENERLKEENKWLKEKNKIIFERLSAYEEDADVQIALFSDVKRYEQALEEIREFSENFCSDNCPYYEVEETNICNDGCLLDNIVNPIIDKINEVIGDEQCSKR